MSRRRVDPVRRDLWEIIIRYKTSLASGELLPIDRREEDRTYLHGIREDLSSATHQILDSKAYLQLSTMQEESGRRFLAAGTDPDTRLRMLGRLVRALATPIVFVGGRSTVSFGSLERSTADLGGEDVEEAESGRISLPPASVRARPVDEVQIEAARRRLASVASRAASLDELRESISIGEAELLSQLASSGQVTIPALGLDPEDDEAAVSFVLKAD